MCAVVIPVICHSTRHIGSTMGLVVAAGWTDLGGGDRGAGANLIWPNGACAAAGAGSQRRIAGAVYLSGMTQPFVLPDFAVPMGLEGDGFRLEPLGPEHNERDYAAWMSSIDHIHSIPGFDDPQREWPTVMSMEENLADLEMHARHFTERVGFTYSVLDGDEVIGCVYIYPTPQPQFDAEVRSWVTERRAEMDVAVWEAVSEWLETEWPFDRPFYAPRG